MTIRSLLFALFTFIGAVSVVSAQKAAPPIADGFRTGQLKIQAQSIFASKMSGVTPECKQEEIAFAEIASQFPLPEKWTFYVVCDEASWDNYVSKIAIAEHLGLSAEVYAATYQQAGYTVIRGYKLTHPDALTTPERVVAHELAHIYTHSNKEDAVDKLARTWLKAKGDTRIAGADVATLVDTK